VERVNIRLSILTWEVLRSRNQSCPQSRLQIVSPKSRQILRNSGIFYLVSYDESCRTRNAPIASYCGENFFDKRSLENKTMGWFNRIFGKKDEAPAAEAAPADVPAGEIPPERVGPDGNFDQSGLAKRVAMAFDQDSMVADLERVWVAQTGSQVVLKGEVPTSEHLNRLVEIANNVNGASAVSTDQVQVTG
jgi:hypothetical protein